MSDKLKRRTPSGDSSEAMPQGLACLPIGVPHSGQIPEILPVRL
jgi:hypothetical protein